MRCWRVWSRWGGQGFMLSRMLKRCRIT